MSAASSSNGNVATARGATGTRAAIGGATSGGGAMPGCTLASARPTTSRTSAGGGAGTSPAAGTADGGTGMPASSASRNWPRSSAAIKRALTRALRRDRTSSGGAPLAARARRERTMRCS